MTIGLLSMNRLISASGRLLREGSMVCATRDGAAAAIPLRDLHWGLKMNYPTETCYGEIRNAPLHETTPAIYNKKKGMPVVRKEMANL